ncbi:MAG TPA: hypothetical protein VGU64_00500, partial [Terriglobales bacterium]|nr:hypothetical protein [Terriglobales bacterium]
MMKLRYLFLAAVLLSCLGFLPGSNVAHAESTISCPSGTYDMLDWMTMDLDLRSSKHLTGTANPLYTLIHSGKFYWTKGGTGYPWDIQLYDNNYIYLWITEYAWKYPNTYKKSSNNYNMPLTRRCAKGGFPGSAIKVSNTSYDIHTDCNSYTTHNLQKAINEVWGPYYVSFGGSLPNKMPTLVVSYRYNCDSNYGNCADKEEYYLSKRYGLVQWVHYTLSSGSYHQQQK